MAKCLRRRISPPGARRQLVQRYASRRAPSPEATSKVIPEHVVEFASSQRDGFFKLFHLSLRRRRPVPLDLSRFHSLAGSYCPCILSGVVRGVVHVHPVIVFIHALDELLVHFLSANLSLFARPRPCLPPPSLSCAGKTISSPNVYTPTLKAGEFRREPVSERLLESALMMIKQHLLAVVHRLRRR